MKKTIIFLFAILFTLLTIAQPPQMFNYQAVVRNASGDPVTGQTVGIQIEILEGSISGTAIYTEVHDVLTDDLGLTTLAIGNGTSGDDFTSVDWGADDYFIKVSADIDGGTDYVEMGTSQLLSVPYALYAEEAENALDKVAFSAYNGTSDTKSAAGQFTVDFDTEIFDLGNNYNPANSTFTAPCDGVYLISAIVAIDDLAAGTQVFAKIYVDDDVYVYFDGGIFDESSAVQIVSGSETIQLNAGDEVNIRIFVSGDSDYIYYGYSGGYETHFSGHLVFRL